MYLGQWNHFILLRISVSLFYFILFRCDNQNKKTNFISKLAFFVDLVESVLKI